MRKDELYKQLYNLRALKKEIERHTNKLNELADLSTNITPNFSGLPSSVAVSDKVGNTAAIIADYQEELKQIKCKRIREEQRLMVYVNQISDARIRLMVELYFLDWHTWNEVADKIGGGNTEDTCRIAVKRYFKRGGKIE